MDEDIDVERAAAGARTPAIMPARRRIGGSNADRPSAPALLTAAASSDVDTPAIGACTMGSGIPRVSSNDIFSP
jgi:hypothetical protein